MNTISPSTDVARVGTLLILYFGDACLTSKSLRQVGQSELYWQKRQRAPSLWELIVEISARIEEERKAAGW